MSKEFIIKQWRKGFDTHAIMVQHNAVYQMPIREHEVWRVIQNERQERLEAKNQNPAISDGA